MEVVLLESEAYTKLQKTNISLIRALLEEERAQQPVFGWLSHKEAAKLLGACSRTMQTWRDSGVLGFSQVGKKIYYRYEDIDKMLRKYHRKPFRAVA